MALPEEITEQLPQQIHNHPRKGKRKTLILQEREEITA